MAAMLRIKREISRLSKEHAPGIRLVTELLDDRDLSEIYVDIQVENNPLYARDTYRIRFRIPPQYPVEVPWVQFVRTSPTAAAASTATSDAAAGSALAPAHTQFFKIPLHPHVYSNGHICLDILGEGWTPIHTVMSVSLSLQSMLAGNDKGERPEGDEAYVKHAPINPKNTSWIYHDDSV